MGDGLGLLSSIHQAVVKFQSKVQQPNRNRIIDMEIIWRFISLEGERREWGGKVQGLRSIIGRNKIDRERLRIVWEMEKPENLHV